MMFRTRRSSQDFEKIQILYNMRKFIPKILCEDYKEHYKKLISMSGINRSKHCLFVPLVGPEYPQDENDGILFIGRAVNGWDMPSSWNSAANTHDDSQLLIDDIFNSDQSIRETIIHHKDYSFQGSAFWRMINRLSEQEYESGWYDKIAYSNLYKLAPFGANPNEGLKNKQKEICMTLLRKEIEILSPKYVILFTGEYWAGAFLLFLCGGQLPKPKTEQWGKYESKSYIISGIKYILTEHPQCKDENQHFTALRSLMAL